MSEHPVLERGASVLQRGGAGCAASAGSRRPYQACSQHVLRVQGCRRAQACWPRHVCVPALPARWARNDGRSGPHTDWQPRRQVVQPGAHPSAAASAAAAPLRCPSAPGSAARTHAGLLRRCARCRLGSLKPAGRRHVAVCSPRNLLAKAFPVRERPHLGATRTQGTVRLARWSACAQALGRWSQRTRARCLSRQPRAVSASYLPAGKQEVAGISLSSSAPSDCEPAIPAGCSPPSEHLKGLSRSSVHLVAPRAGLVRKDEGRVPGRYSLAMLGTWGADVRAGGCSGNTLLPHLHQPRLAKDGATATRVCRAAHVNAWLIGSRRCAARLAHGTPHCSQRRCRQQVVCAAGQRYVSPRQRWRQLKQDVWDLAERARQGFMCAHAHAHAWQHARAQAC